LAAEDNQKKAPLSFQTQLTIMIAIALTIMLALFLAFINFNVNKDLEQNLINQTVTKTKLVGERAKNALLSADFRASDKVIRQLSSSPSLQAAAIILPNRSVLSYFSIPDGLPLPDIVFTPPLRRSENRLIIVEPIQEDGNIVGYIYVAHQLQTLLERENTYFVYVMAIFAGMLLISFFIARYFKHLLTYPISRMVTRINNIYRSGNFKTRLAARSDDEIGKLINEFNQMLDTVQERENELTAQSNQLQRLVEVRTEQLYQKAHFDSLTGLPNRYLLVDRLHQAISKSSRSNTILGLLFLDLDRFKIINDNLGHQNGDLLLKEVAKRLSKIAREGDTVARLGGDEFIFLLEDLASPKSAALTAKRVIESLKTPFRIQEHILHVSTSIGISIYPDDGLDHKALLKNADISMYHAKDKGPGHFSFYSQDMNETSLERLAIESNLRSAISNNEFYLLYQPQLSLKDNQCRNVEALLRWSNAEVGVISPGVFIPIAEESGLINQIDLWVISQACKQIHDWNKQGINDITVAVNVSAGHLISDSLLEHIKSQILLNQIKASQLEIEITEAVFVEHTRRTIETLVAIKKLGVKIAIDDFGTGYSSLQYIQNFPVDTLKLDGMFIRNLQQNEASQGIVRSTIILAHSLGLELVSECVEDDFQLEYLRENGCDLIQGYLFAKPLVSEQVPKFYRATNLIAPTIRQP